MSDTGELRTERLVLQPLSMSDHAGLLAHWTGPLVRRHLFDGYLLSAGDVTETIVASQRDFAMAGYGLWALRLAGRHTLVDASLIGTSLVGTAGLRRMETDTAADAEIEIVYSLEPHHWGEGLAAEAAVAVLSYAFDVLGLPRVVAEIDEGNGASAAVAERLGLRSFDAVARVLGPMTHYAVERGLRAHP